MRTTASILALFAAAPAFAGNIEPVAEAPVIIAPAAPVLSWAGGYAGGSLGFVDVEADDLQGDVDGDDDDDDDDDIAAALFDLDDNGVGYGLHAGFNFQNGQVVWGPEIAVFDADVDLGTDLTDIELDYGVRVALRGGIARGSNLFYGLLGGAYLRAESDSPLGNSDGDEVGYAAGFGYERLVSENLVVGAQYTLHSVDDLEFDEFGEGSEVDVEYRVLELRASFKF